MLNAIALLVMLAGSPEMAAPSDSDIIRAMPRVRGVLLPYVCEVFCEWQVIVKNRLSDPKISPLVFYPFIGPARIATTNWECVVYYTHTIQSEFPFFFQVTKNRVQVIYMKKAELAK